jgi:hypothetical protein
MPTDKVSLTPGARTYLHIQTFAGDGFGVEGGVVEGGVVGGGVGVVDGGVVEGFGVVDGGVVGGGVCVVDAGVVDAGVVDAGVVDGFGVGLPVRTSRIGSATARRRSASVLLAWPQSKTPHSPTKALSDS